MFNSNKGEDKIPGEFKKMNPKLKPIATKRNIIIDK